MLAAALDRRDELRVLAIGCHPDDIEIGCGGTILDLAERRPDLELTWLALSADGTRANEAQASARGFLEGLVTTPQIFVESFRDGFFPYEGAAVKERFEQLKAQVSPDVIFTHAATDRHQDHRLACELTWNTFRDHLILEYEIPKWDADLTPPNVYVPLTEATVRRKVDLLNEHFASQREKHWFTDDLFRALLRLRGMEANAESGYAEAFHCRKLVLTV
jgi:LmbE family N-acetylglucosaminyl deacetylase